MSTVVYVAHLDHGVIAVECDRVTPKCAFAKQRWLVFHCRLQIKQGERADQTSYSEGRCTPGFHLTPEDAERALHDALLDDMRAKGEALREAQAAFDRAAARVQRLGTGAKLRRLPNPDLMLRVTDDPPGPIDGVIECDEQLQREA